MPPSSTAPPRFEAIDLLRGFVMVLMTIDHASGAFNAGRFMQDFGPLWKAGTPIPEGQFLLRWLTHLCAPTFVFLAGTSIALSSAKRAAQGESRASIDNVLLRRGLFVLLVDPIWMSLAFMGYHGIIFQVMYALGASMMLMVPLRRLSARTLAIGSVLFCLASEALVGASIWLGHGKPTLLSALTLSAGSFPLPFTQPNNFIVAYPALPWLALMALGHAFGSHLLTAGASERVAPKLTIAGLAMLAVFAVVRGVDGYGNMLLHRDGTAFVQWLHVSKYPPALSYVTLELGIGALLLALCFVITRTGTPTPLTPIRLLGQTALFFYLLHAHLLEAAASLLGLREKAGVGVTLLAAALTLLVLWPVCRWYAAYKRAHPNGLARYV